MGTEKISASPFYFFFYVCNDSANAVEDFGILFFANRQFFLKFSKIYKKKINFEAFSCMFPYREVIREVEKRYTFI